MIKKAMILAAGFGKRLNPLTLDCPKPLLKISKETLLSNTLKFLKQFGIEHVVINLYYLSDQITEYINKNNFDLDITLIEEKNKILDTGGGVLNAIEHFSNQPFLIINPDTIWDKEYLKEIKKMKNFFLSDNQNKCCLLVVDKKKSFDKSLKGDFVLKNNLISKTKNKKNFKYIYTGLQIIKPENFSNLDLKIFSMNMIWDNLIKNNSLHGIESKINFLHINNLKIYKSLQKKNFKN